MARRSDTKSRILDLAEQLLQDRGWNGFSYQHIASKLGVKNAAIHYHYPTKSDLGVAILDRLRRRFQRWCDAIEAETDDFWEKLDAFFAIYQSYLADQGKICPAGALEAEFNALSDEMRRATRALVTVFHGWLTATLEAGRDRGACVFQGDPAEQAMLIGCTLQGSLQVARAWSPERFHETVRHLRKQMVPPTPPGKGAARPAGGRRRKAGASSKQGRRSGV